LIGFSESRKGGYWRPQAVDRIGAEIIRIGVKARKWRGFGLLSLAGRVILTVHPIEKGGPRDDDNFPALSPAWPGQRPANAFAGLTRLLETSFWSALRGRASRVF
jgi:hypothetical protein